MTIFTELLRVLDGSTGKQSRNIFLFVNSSAAHPQSMSILGNVKAAYFQSSCVTLLQNLDLGIIKVFWETVQETHGTKSCMHVGLRKGCYN